MVTFISHSAAETWAFGEQQGRIARAGQVFGLSGELGAGKTHFVKGFAAGLGVTEPVLSPTFALVHVYESGRLPLYHLDFYRLEDDEQIIGAGLAEYLTPAGVALIEWWDRWQGEAPPGLARFSFEVLNEAERRITYECSGA